MAVSPRSSPVDRLLASRREVLQLVVVAGVLALCVAVLAVGAVDLFRNAAYWGAAATAIGCVSYLIWRRLSPRQQRAVVDGLVIYDGSRDCRLVPVNDYQFSEALAQFLEYAFAERPALLAQWKSEPLNAPEWPDEAKRSAEASHALVVELVEYVVLHWLSLDLGEFFNWPVSEKSRLTVVHRNDIPDVLLKNRFLELFSQPFKDRMDPSDASERISIIQVDTQSGMEREVTIIQRGQYFQFFELLLPSGSRLSREGDGTVVIDGNLVRLTFKPVFTAYHEMLPTQFARLYMRREEMNTATALTVSLVVTTTVKRRALLARRGWDEYSWIAAFTEKLEDRFGFEAFSRRIGWPVAEATARSVETILLRDNRPDGESLVEGIPRSADPETLPGHREP